jgi:hypothetical protein
LLISSAVAYLLLSPHSFPWALPIPIIRGSAFHSSGKSASLLSSSFLSTGWCLDSAIGSRPRGWQLQVPDRGANFVSLTGF